MTDFVIGRQSYDDLFEDDEIEYYEDDLSEKSDRHNKFVEKNKKILKSIKCNFNTNYLAHIGTVNRALCNKADNDIITFSCSYNDKTLVTYEIKCENTKEECVYGILNSINLLFIIEDKKIDIQFNVQDDSILLNFISDNNDILIKGFSISDNFEPRLLLSNYGVLRALISSLDASFDFSLNKEKYASDSYYRQFKGIDFSDEQKSLLEIYLKELSKIRPLFTYTRFSFRRLYTYFTRNINDIEYIYAHSVTQSVLYNFKDTSDYLSRTIHEFANKNITRNSKIHEFIVRWMKIFNIGIDYKLDSFGGESHIVKITNTDKRSVNLADKGMGSIQLMTLLFRIATKMKDLRSVGNRYTTIIIEEPEQNLHPMLQSKLADLFYELYDKYRFNFIIETHSEYLIRKSQVLVNQLRTKRNKRSNNPVNNPFKVYYFPSEGVPYDMDYAPDGSFNEDFGTGFFDEASNLAFQVL